MSCVHIIIIIHRTLTSICSPYTTLFRSKDDLSKTTIYAPLTGRVIKLNAEEGEVVVSGTMNNPGSVIGTIADLSEIDRKSTRLNSSHLGISYAVLCLKIKSRTRFYVYYS